MYVIGDCSVNDQFFSGQGFSALPTALVSTRRGCVGLGTVMAA